MAKLAKGQAHQIYKTSSGRIVPGASSVCKIGEDTGGITHWAWKLGTEGKDYRKEKDWAADIGHVCHGMIEAWLKNEELDYSDYFPEDSKEAEIARKGLGKFQSLWNDEGFTLLHSELQLVSNAYEYGGTLDVMALDRMERKTLLDIKATNAIRLSNFRQIAAYEHLYNENYSDEEPVARRGIARVGKTDAKLEAKFLPPVDEYFKTFLIQLELYYQLRQEPLNGVYVYRGKKK